jgi:hypothetical protein
MTNGKALLCSADRLGCLEFKELPARCVPEWKKLVPLSEKGHLHRTNPPQPELAPVDWSNGDWPHSEDRLKD